MTHDLRAPAGSPVAFALDLPDLDAARRVAEVVAPHVGMLKIGLELFVAHGPAVVAPLRELGLPIFLDLKLHDIPETVERAVARASALGVSLLTVHAAGGRAMLERAVARADREGAGLSVCAVTVLTSLDAADARDIGLARSPSETVPKVARLAFDAGVRAFVCSPAEVAGLRTDLGPDAVLVTPGVRPANSEAGDQKRTTTPAAAIAAGATWLVVGRPIRDAERPADAARAISAEARSARGAS
ncbi:MAG: orotidine-5'-phosphate decarboxylase [Myxococcales bacterium]|nr:orotidine-5'-phosphate decarboxylase [Myxococcales bacterium]